MNKEQLIPCPDGRFLFKYQYRNKQRCVYYREVPCSGCGVSRITSDSNFKKAFGRAFCRKCQSEHVSGSQRIGRKFKRGSKGGYVLIYVPEHPKSKHGYVSEHRLVVEKEIGRFLLDSELVHHIDCDKQNNSADNLAIVDCFQHNKAHSSIEKCVKSLMASGALKFDGEKREYYTCP